MQFYYYDVRVDAKASVSLYLDFFSLSNNAKAERLLLRFKKKIDLQNSISALVQSIA